jgi:hypothetical protein
MYSNGLADKSEEDGHGGMNDVISCSSKAGRQSGGNKMRGRNEMDVGE